ncbi:hypothetical protein Pfo_011064 [Paulownia fortunei]|nr:hypothetical protein Pfo_011064 [Paulownia fortunei]
MTSLNAPQKTQYPGSNYLCSSKKSSCDTFIVYRAQENYQTLTSISSLFNTSISQLLLFNMSQTDPNNLQPGREIIVPVTCSCPERFSEAVYLYNASKSDSLSVIACEVFEGLLKAQRLMEDNPDFGGHDFSLIEVPIKCACPDAADTGDGTNFLVTYPVTRTDTIFRIARKFGVSEQMIFKANNLDHPATIFPQTTLLIPTKDVPILNLDVLPSPQDPYSSPEQITIIVFLILLVSGIWILIRRHRNHLQFQTFSTKNPPLSPLSPDLLDGMSKLKNSPTYFILEEIRNATKYSSEDCLMGSTFYRGKICDSHVAIEEINSTEAANNVISILTKINHLNVVKLEGYCHQPKPFLVHEFVENGSLRECLSNPKLSSQLTWKRRVQIAIDIAVGLHYIHYCTRPNYIHQNINRKSILITADWRATISGFRWAKSLILGRFLSTKMDVYAFGIILLELLSGKEAFTNGIPLKDFLKLPGLQDSSGCLETLKTFMDPVLKKDYSFGGAMCLALLAMGCVEEDLIQRLSINDMLKTVPRNL